MRRRLTIAGALFLCVVVTLLAGASVALAAPTCVDCHAAPPDGPPAPHGTLVAAVTTCVTCHVGMVPHPASLRTPILTLTSGSSETGYVVKGSLGRPAVLLGANFVGFPAVTVYLQQRLWAATDFTDLTTATTSSTAGALGAFSFTVATPAPFATYRAIAHGVTGLAAPAGGTWRSSVAVLLPKPKLTLKLAGLKDGVLAFGDSLKASGTVLPVGLKGETVKLVVMRNRAGQWVRVKVVSCEISATDTFAGVFEPAKTGTYRIQATLAKSDLHRAVATSWKKFKVK